MPPRLWWIVAGREGFVTGSCVVHPIGQSMAGVYAFVEPDRPGDIPLVRVTMAGSAVRFPKVGIDVAPGNA